MGSIIMTLRDALACAYEALDVDSIKQDELRAQILVRLYRRVNAIAMPLPPVATAMQASKYGVGDLIPAMQVVQDEQLLMPDGVTLAGSQAIFQAEPAGDGVMPPAAGDDDDLGGFDMLMDSSDFILDGMF
ncbi:hypothetical protein KEM52_003272 [Ascosphaera acerosa]|nr:hypothetical protein KEM52_003272 [Ascosphaera acerosa]